MAQGFSPGHGTGCLDGGRSHLRPRPHQRLSLLMGDTKGSKSIGEHGRREDKATARTADLSARRPPSLKRLGLNAKTVRYRLRDASMLEEPL